MTLPIMFQLCDRSAEALIASPSGAIALHFLPR
jgi:hypothetical protein